MEARKSSLSSSGPWRPWRLLLANTQRCASNANQSFHKASTLVFPCHNCSSRLISPQGKRDSLARVHLVSTSLPEALAVSCWADLHVLCRWWLRTVCSELHRSKLTRPCRCPLRAPVSQQPCTSWTARWGHDIYSSKGGCSHRCPLWQSQDNQTFSCNQCFCICFVPSQCQIVQDCWGWGQYQNQICIHQDHWNAYKL